MKITDYEQLLQQHEAAYHKQQKQYNLIGTIRLVLAALILLTGYLGIKYGGQGYWAGAIALCIGFAVVYKKHQKVSRQRNLLRQLIQINKDEIAYLNRTAIPFEEGKEYVDPSHAYTYDLDIFGARSLFHQLNRTYTFIGKNTFAKLLGGLLSNAEILQNQQAIAELKNKTEWRQHIVALARSKNDTAKKYDQLQEWANSPLEQLSGTAKVLSIAGPVAFVAAAVYCIITGSYHLSLIHI